MTDNAMTVRIPKKATERFFSNLKSVLTSMDSQDIEELRLYVKGRSAIAISFDSSLHPFLGRTTGLNEEEQRTRGLNESLFVLQLIQARLAVERDTGGRVFLDSTGAYWVDKTDNTGSGNEKHLVDWCWPGRDLVERVRALKHAAWSA